MKKLLFGLMLFTLAFMLTACGGKFNSGDTIVAESGAGELRSTLNEPWSDTTICTPNPGEKFVVEEVSWYMITKEDQAPVYKLQSLDRPETKFDQFGFISVQGCWGWTGPGDEDD